MLSHLNRARREPCQPEIVVCNANAGGASLSISERKRRLERITCTFATRRENPIVPRIGPVYYELWLQQLSLHCLVGRNA
jgi:hypothetical protein